MPDVICNTSPLQYLHQTGLLRLLHELAGRIIVPPAVVDELAAGRSLGIDLPDPVSLNWVIIREPAGAIALPLVTNLGRGEAEVLALCLEIRDSVAILDDMLARRSALALGVRLTGTLGVLLSAKEAGFLSSVGPVLNQLHSLGFRIAPATRAAVLEKAGEA